MESHFLNVEISIVSPAGVVDLAGDAQRSGDDDIRTLLDRLGARLGPERVQRLRLQADHRPERLHRAAHLAGERGEIARPEPAAESAP